jgi:hypothetical protein
MSELRPITYSLQFRGRASQLRPDLIGLELTAPSSALVTTIGASGLRGRFEDVLGGEAFLRSESSFDDLSFRDHGTIEFGRSNRLRFRSIRSQLVNRPSPELRLGGVIRSVENGDGQFSEAEGLIASTFLISDTGEVTDYHLGLIFVHAAHKEDLP